jgi:hypothetical protein
MVRRVVAGCLVCVVAVVGRLGAGEEEQKVAQAVIDHAVKAMGGAEAVGRMKSLTWKAKARITVNEVDATSTEDWSARGFDKYHADITLTLNDNTISGTLVVAGDKGWSKANDRTTELPKGLAPGLLRIFRTGRLMHTLPLLKDKRFTLSPLGELKIGDKDAIGVRVAEKNFPDVSLYFDKKTGLPLKAEVRATELDGDPERSYEFFFSDYKDFDGIKHPGKIVVHREGKKAVDAEISDVKPQDLDNGLFEKP